jgi:CheY-like chemotaxis protein
MPKSGHRDDGPPEVLAGKCILVAEDDPDNQKIVSMILSGKGASALPAANAAEFRALLNDVAERARTPPDAVILDWNLAGASGDELLTELRTRCPELAGRILIVTGDVLRRETDSSAGHGDRSRHGPCVLLKPFSPADLTNALSEMLSAPDQG